MITTASAPGKIILFGEHAVVYGQPALAVPVQNLQATAHIENRPAGHGVTIRAEDLNIDYKLSDKTEHALQIIIRLTLDALEVNEPDIQITVQSSIPIAAGLGSGAAISACVARALAEHLGKPLPVEQYSALVYEVEKLHHGTPSGIDNTVICYEQPVYFIRDKVLETFRVKQPFHILIGNTGVPGLTKITVGKVREGWQQDPDRYNGLFQQVGNIVNQARHLIETGQPEQTGELMAWNHDLLCTMGVSSPELDRLVEAAQNAGAPGAKLSGGGGGGNMIALVYPEQITQVTDSLLKAGAAAVYHTIVR